MSLIEAHRNLAGKVAVVVGGAAGFIGRGVTLGLASAGVQVICADNDREGLALIGAEAEAAGGNAWPVFAEGGDEASLDAFWDEVAAGFERVDIVVNVAGGGRRALFEHTTRADHARDIRMNYDHVVQSCHRAIPLLRRSGQGGAIVNFTTIEAHRGAATYAVYAGAKAAITNFSRALAVELGADQIRVNCLASDTTPARASMARAIEFYVPQKRAPSVDDVVNALLFLVSDLSRAITGTTLFVDGGTQAAFGFLNWPGGDGFMPAPLGGSLGRLLD